MDPIDFARVTVFDFQTGRPIRSVMTDAQGLYEIAGLPAGRIQVRATKTGYADAWASGVNSRADASVYTLLPGQTLAQTWDAQRVLFLNLLYKAGLFGTVLGVNDNASADPPSGPVAGARVDVFADRTGRKVGSTVTDGEGRFLVQNLPDGVVRVRASKRGWLPGWAVNASGSQAFAVVAGLQTDVGTLRLSAPATVHGMVMVGDREMTGRARLTVIDVDSHHVIRSVIIGSRFSIGGLAAGRIRLHVDQRGSEGWSPLVTLRPGTVLGPDASTGAVTIRLVRGAIVTGTVKGVGAAGAQPVSLPSAHVLVVDAHTGRTLGSAFTDGFGRFRVGRLPAGPVKISVSGSGWLTSWAPGRRTFRQGERYVARTARTTDIGTVALYAPAAIQGSTLSWLDPVGGVTVSVVDATTGQTLARTVSDVNAQYRVDGLWPGPVKVKAAKPGYTTNWANSHVQLTEETATVFTLAPGQTLSQTWSPVNLYLDIVHEVVVEGRVLGDMAPLGGARVSVLDAASDRVLGTATSDATGHYRIEHVNPMAAAAIQVKASKPGWRTSWANGAWTRDGAASFDIHPGWVIQQSSDPEVLFLNLARLP